MCELSGGACSGLGASREAAGKGEAVEGDYLQRMNCLLRETVFYFRNTFNIVTFVKYLPLVLASFWHRFGIASLVRLILLLLLALVPAQNCRR